MQQLDTAGTVQQAVALHGQGRLWEAEQVLEGLLRADDRHFGAIYQLGLIRLHQNRFQDAASLLRRAVKLNKRSAEAHHQLAIALTGLDRFEAAVHQYEKATAIAPRNHEAHNNLGYTLERLGRAKEAITHYERAIALVPNYPEARNNRGNALQLLNRLEEAVAEYQRALALRPTYADAYNNLGNALSKLARHEEALLLYHRAITLRPNYPVFQLSLANALAALERNHDALAQYEKTLALAPDNPDVHAGLGQLLFNMGRAEAALAHCEKALTLRPQHAAAHHHHGIALRAIGRLDEAIESFEKAIELAKTPGAYYALATSTRIKAGSRHFQALADLAKTVSALEPEDQTALHFAMGKVLADNGESRRSFHHFTKGNALKRRRLHYDQHRTFALFEIIRETYTAELLRAKAGHGDPSPIPVFIVGMPRSGTTLVEQILASHPKVYGAGELREVGNVMASAQQPDHTEWASLGARASPEQLRQLGSRYLHAVRHLAPEAERITDKMPGNFVHAGIIHLILPNARFIHTRRDPSDNALSCFSLLFAQGQEFTYDLAELGRYYAAYERLMEHWRQVLPEGIMLEIQYEEVVEDFENQARRIVAHCGLEWDEACLAFHKTKRTVRTASVIQVRQPIYRSSVGRSEANRDLMRPFLDALDEARAAYPRIA